MRLKKSRKVANEPPPNRQRILALGALLALVTFVAYFPSLGGDFIWDDPDYVVNNQTLRSAAGLVEMWTNIRSLPQWYPMVHTTYWFEYQLFGLNPLVFKLNNLLLHIATALLLWRLLNLLKLPGAYFAAFVFAVHPVHVESVAWITERKNALSGFFYVGAFIAYLKWRLEVGSWRLDDSNVEPSHQTSTLKPQTSPRWYIAALGLFVLALLSKTVTASLPAAILVVTWWRCGRIRVRDVLSLLPFFALGITMGLITAYLERHHVGAVGPQWDYSPTTMGEFATRTLIAGRAVWFYFGKLVWPWPLAFMYERWVVDVSDLRQWVYPVGTASVILLLALGRNRPVARGALCAALLFVGTLFPALGYFNVYPHRYSFVADHFQHLASIAVTSAICAGLVLIANRLQIAAKPQAAIGAAIVIVLGVLTFLQSRIYESPVTLWTDTTKKSPGNWIGFTALGRALADAKQIEPAMAAHRRAYELNPNVADTNYNLAMVDARFNNTDSAEQLLLRTLELTAPTNMLQIDAMIKLGFLYEDQRKNFDGAEQWFKRAVDAGKRTPVGSYFPADQAYADFLRRRGTR